MTPAPRLRPSSRPPVQYKGRDLDPERGPGLGCFWLQLVVLGILVVLTPIGVNLGWPDWLTALLLFATIGVLLLSGQTIIFLLRLVAAERREGRRRPMAGRSQTVGELEEGAGSAAAPGPASPDRPASPPGSAAPAADAVATGADAGTSHVTGEVAEAADGPTALPLDARGRGPVRQ